MAVAGPGANRVVSMAAPINVPPVGWFPPLGYVPTFRELLAGRGTRRWFIGAGIACLILLASIGSDFTSPGRPPWLVALMWVHLLAFVIAFLVGPPLSWYRGPWAQGAMAVGFLALSTGFFAYRDSTLGVTWLWTFVAVFVATQGLPRVVTSIAIGGLAGGGMYINLSQGVDSTNAFSQAVTIGAVGLMMMAFSRQLSTIRVLRQTQHELAELAVREERSRVARDMHDILGHSLTVIAVKAELAGRLLEAAPAHPATEKAATEIADMEDLARGALEDVRATVSGYRGVNILSELASARTALTAAGIDAELPGVADAVPAKHRELFGWVLREGITNVIRHADANRCVVTLGAAFLQIDDDGVGPGGPVTTRQQTDGQEDQRRGNGLAGAGERAETAGATLTVGRSELGGFRLRLQL